MNDDKTARDYNIEGGSVLHLVCFLSGENAPLLDGRLLGSMRRASKNLAMDWELGIIMVPLSPKGTWSGLRGYNRLDLL